MTYGAECWAVRKKDENRLHVADMMMLRRIWGKTRNVHVRNQVIQEHFKVCQMSKFEAEQIKLVWTHQKKRGRQDHKKKRWTWLYLGNLGRYEWVAEAEID